MLKNRLFFPVLLCAVVLFEGHSAAAESREIVVSAAISLRNAFTDIGQAFEAGNKDVTVSFNFGASGDLKTQIMGGAPADVFASAALKDMDALDADGLLVGNTRVNFVSNAVVLIQPAASGTVIASFDDLKKPEVKKIAMGNPRSVPAGRYADEVLHALKLGDALADKLVLAENVRQVLDYVCRNEVDAGIVYSTDAGTRPGETRVILAAPKGSHKPILYPLAVVKGSKQEQTARAFITFVRSKEGKTILERYGFKPVE
jgi:molybdate transport system substrate-binding protein